MTHSNDPDTFLNIKSFRNGAMSQIYHLFVNDKGVYMFSIQFLIVYLHMKKEAFQFITLSDKIQVEPPNLA